MIDRARRWLFEELWIEVDSIVLEGGLATNRATLILVLLIVTLALAAIALAVGR